MHTMPAARPSSPSTKFTALMVMTTRATVKSVPCHWVSATVPTPGSGIHRIVRPCMTITPAAIIWPPSLIRASISNLSSRTPISQISAAPESSARGSLDFSKSWPRLVRWSATSRPAHRPKNIAIPPSRGVGSRCTSRARISGIAPATIANLRTGPVSRYVTARGRDAERQQVFTHGLPHRSRWPSQPHTLARHAYG
ncbi:hypothetical protein SGRIM128S_00891 [Streptomyces griseomycini]